MLNDYLPYNNFNFILNRTTRIWTINQIEKIIIKKAILDTSFFSSL